MSEATQPARDGSRRGPSKRDQAVAFPRERIADRTAGDNLPVELTSFVGREREIFEVQKLLADARLVTLTGTGGCGKTRLALEVARSLLQGFEHGAWWVGLASLGNPDLVPKSVASALGVREQPGRALSEALSDHLRSRKLLLVLDNCEHLVQACAALSDTLLRACPELKILATSRETLGIAGETSWPVPSLSLPAIDRSPPIEELTRYEATRLFVERASAVVPGFVLTEQNASAVVRVCRELDGIPLAIELAAARVRALTVEQISNRLDDRFRLLAAGSRTALPRQRTLRATIDWSYELLVEEEQTLLRRLSVFAGGFALEAAEEVCAGEGIEKDGVFDLLSQLVDRSLVVMQERGARARYRLLETIRQYAAEKLRGSGEAHVLGRRHADFFLALAEEAEPATAGPEQVVWLERLEAEHDNIRTALGWLGEAGEAERGLRLASALLRFWWYRGHLAEGRTQLEGLLDLCPVVPVRDEVRAKALHALGIHRYADDTLEDWAMVRSRLQESLEIYRRLGDEPRVAAVLQNLGRVRAVLGEWKAAHASLNESLEIGHRLSNEPVTARSLFYLGMAHLHRDDFSPARASFEEGLEIYRKLDDKFWINGCQVHLGYVDCEEGEYTAARSRFMQMNETAPLVQVPWGATYALDGFTRLAAAEGEAVRALRLGGATDALRRTYGVTIGPNEQAAFQRRLEPAWRALGTEEGEAAWEEGQAMTLEQAIDFALEEPSTPGEEAQRAPTASHLSVRELEVLSLVAEGLTDAQVAARLHLSPRTIGQHLRSVYNKLGVNNRTAAVKKVGEI